MSSTGCLSRMQLVRFWPSLYYSPLPLSLPLSLSSAQSLTLPTIYILLGCQSMLSVRCLVAQLAQISGSLRHSYYQSQQRLAALILMCMLSYSPFSSTGVTLCTVVRKYNKNDVVPHRPLLQLSFTDLLHDPPTESGTKPKRRRAIVASCTYGIHP